MMYTIENPCCLPESLIQEDLVAPDDDGTFKLIDMMLSLQKPIYWKRLG